MSCCGIFATTVASSCGRVADTHGGLTAAETVAVPFRDTAKFLTYSPKKSAKNWVSLRSNPSYCTRAKYFIATVN